MPNSSRFLFFFYLIEGIDAENAAAPGRRSSRYESIFAGDWTLRNPLNAPAKGVDDHPARPASAGRSGRDGLSGEALVRFVRDEVFPVLRRVGRRVRARTSCTARVSSSTSRRF